MDRPTKVVLIALCWILVVQHTLGSVPSALGSWGAGIDLMRHTVHRDGRIDIHFFDNEQWAWYSQSKSDHVYGLVFATVTLLSGAQTLEEELAHLYWIPVSLVGYALGALATARLVLRRVPPGPMATALHLILPLVFMVPLGRLHVLLIGVAGNALAPALLVIVLYLLMRIALSRENDWRLGFASVVFSFALINTYHTWASYFAVLSAAALLWLLLTGAHGARHTRALALLLAAPPLFWFANAVFLGSDLLHARLLQFVFFLKTLKFAEASAGFYGWSSADPLGAFVRPLPLLAAHRILNLAGIVIFSALLAACAWALLGAKRRRAPSPLVDIGLSWCAGSAACWLALFAIGGPGLVISRGFEILGVTGPFIIATALARESPAPWVPAAESARVPSLRAWGRGEDRLRVAVAGFACVNLIAAALHIPATLPEEALSPAEMDAVSWVATESDPHVSTWSDHRLAPALLYFSPRNFTTFEFWYWEWEQHAAVSSLFYGDECSGTLEALRYQHVQLALITEFMESTMIVRRAPALLPTDSLRPCLEDAGARVYDNGAATLYAMPPGGAASEGIERVSF